jgi:hypothetical protein
MQQQSGMARRNKADFDPQAFAEAMKAQPQSNGPESTKEMQRNVRTVELMDGPLEGTMHAIEPGLPVPNRIGRKDKTDSALMHWYRVIDDKGYLECSELTLTAHEKAPPIFRRAEQ